MAKYTLYKHPKIEMHTFLKEHFECFQGELEKLDWLVVDADFDFAPKGMPYPYQGIYEISGSDLFEKFGGDSKSSPQIIWGTLLGFEKGKRPNLESVKDQLSSAKRLESSHPQQSDAKIEINCFDSTLTEIYTDDEDFIKKIEEYWKIKKDDVQ